MTPKPNKASDLMNQPDPESDQVYIEADHIVINPPQFGEYPIPLDRCDTPLKLLDWINQLLGKNDLISKRHIELFLKLACDTHGINFYGEA